MRKAQHYQIEMIKSPTYNVIWQTISTQIFELSLRFELIEQDNREQDPDLKMKVLYLSD